MSNPPSATPEGGGPTARETALAWLREWNKGYSFAFNSNDVDRLAANIEADRARRDAEYTESLEAARDLAHQKDADLAACEAEVSRLRASLETAKGLLRKWADRERRCGDSGTPIEAETRAFLTPKTATGEAP